MAGQDYFISKIQQFVLTRVQPQKTREGKIWSAERALAAWHCLYTFLIAKCKSYLHLQIN